MTVTVLRSEVYLQACEDTRGERPAGSMRFVTHWKDVIHRAWLDPSNTADVATFIADFAIKIGTEMAGLLWMAAAMEKAAEEVIEERHSHERIDARISLAHLRLDELEKRTLENERAGARILDELVKLTERVDRIAAWCTEQKRKERSNVENGKIDVAGMGPGPQTTERSGRQEVLESAG